MPSDTPAASRRAWPRVLSVIGGILLLFAALLLLWLGWWTKKITNAGTAAFDKATGMVKEAGRQAVTVAKAFREHNVRQEFLSSAVTLQGTSRLQVATLQEHEAFRRKESDSVMWGLIALPQIVVQADVPVEYGFYVNFQGPWEFRQEEGVVTVFPPPILPNTPAPDISKLTFYTLEGHVWQDDKAVRDRLQSSLTASLRDRAQEHVPLVREIARRQVEDFVSRWLAQSFSDGRAFRVKVVFPEERPATATDAPKALPQKAP